MTSLMPPQPIDATCQSYSEIRVEGNNYPIMTVNGPAGHLAGCGKKQIPL
jgi:hypothetical protein